MLKESRDKYKGRKKHFVSIHQQHTLYLNYIYICRAVLIKIIKQKENPIIMYGQQLSFILEKVS